MDDVRTITITSPEFSPEDAAKIPRRLRGNTFRGAHQLTRHLRLYGPPKFEGDEYEGVSSDDDGSEDILEREIGHITSICTLTHLRCGDNNLARLKLYEKGHMFPT
uniref:Uncharacterized protein n=1 Tax=Oryza punctata TaxID=4537 RepID=A0A0E0MER7_ORYPU